LPDLNNIASLWTRIDYGLILSKHLPAFIKIGKDLNRQLCQDALNLLSPGPDSPLFNSRIARRLAQEGKK